MIGDLVNNASGGDGECLRNVKVIESSDEPAMRCLAMVRLSSVAAAPSPWRLVKSFLVLLTSAFFLLLLTSSRRPVQKLPRRMQERLAWLRRVCEEMPVPSEVAAAAMDEATRLRLLEVLNPTKERFREVSRSPLFLKALMARHPLERLLSAYRDRIEDQTHVTSQAREYGPQILRHTRGLSFSRKHMFHINGTLRVVPTFREFVSYLVSRPPQEYDPHWRPVSLQCGLCHINYTAVVLTETYNEDLHYIMRASGMDQLVDMTLLTKNNNRGKGNTHSLLQQYYSTLEPSLLQKIISVYQNDFKMFNYTAGAILGRVS
ncbi:carbohydrate sulfotransferase 11-like isoform X3 [Scylla paramamosain]|uniref:carbohydrate sulfotransferase 11-like isoform X3 n=1 Tax=Scylla paramamosain TaxID=85552 RepID=UPI003083A3CF